MYLGCVLHAMQSGMESPKDFKARFDIPAAVGRKRRAAPCAVGRYHPSSSGPALSSPSLFLHGW